jgi:hypothetical protein
MDRGTRHLWILALVAAALALVGCETAKPAADITIERLPDVNPNLPAVPTLPPPPFPVQLPDQSYTVYGVRKRIHQTMDTNVTITAYIVEIYTRPPCPDGGLCPPGRIPHMFLADTAGEADPYKRLTVVGYADNQFQIDEATAALAEGSPLLREEGDTRPPVPGDLAVGAKIKIRGRFTRVTGSGFSQSDGVLEYGGHENVDRSLVPDAGVPQRRRR